MSKHTPGPWTIDWYVCREGEKELWRVPRSIGPAYVDHNHWARNHIAVDPADALLIAAAPDLLVALQMVASSDVTLHPYIFNAINAAIAKCNTSPQ